MLSGEQLSPGVGPGDTNTGRQQAPFDLNAWSRPADWPLLITLLIGIVKASHTRLQAADQTIDDLRCELIKEIRQAQSLRALLEQHEPEAMRALQLRDQLNREIDLFDKWFRLMQTMGRNATAEYQKLWREHMNTRRTIDALQARLSLLQQDLGIKDDLHQHWERLLSALRAMIDNHEKGCDCMDHGMPVTPSTVPADRTASARLRSQTPTPQPTGAIPRKDDLVEIRDFNPQGQRAALESRKAEASRLVERWQQTHRNMSITIQTLNVENGELKTQLDAAVSDNRKLSEQNASLSKANATLTQQNTRLQAERDSLRDEVAKLTIRLQEFNDGLLYADETVSFMKELLETHAPPEILEADDETKE